jgi:putative alpha-1,2-mannosidase
MCGLSGTEVFRSNPTRLSLQLSTCIIIAFAKAAGLIMIGTPADAIIADAFVKGFRDYDLQQAWAAIYKDAMTPPNGDEHKRWADRAEWTACEARTGLTHYKTRGYIPADETAESVSCTMEDAFEDFCAAQVAKDLGKDSDYQFFMKPSQNYRNVFNPATGLLTCSRPKFWNLRWDRHRDRRG